MAKRDASEVVPTAEQIAADQAAWDLAYCSAMGGFIAAGAFRLEDGFQEQEAAHRAIAAESSVFAEDFMRDRRNHIRDVEALRLDARERRRQRIGGD